MFVPYRDYRSDYRCIGLKTTIFSGNPVPFVMVLPSYRMPAAKSVWLRMWENVKGFIKKKAFTVIFIATIVIWLLRSFDFGLNMVTDSENSMLAALGRVSFSPQSLPLLDLEIGEQQLR